MRFLDQLSSCAIAYVPQIVVRAHARPTHMQGLLGVRGDLIGQSGPRRLDPSGSIDVEVRRPGWVHEVIVMDALNQQVLFVNQLGIDVNQEESLSIQFD